MHFNFVGMLTADLFLEELDRPSWESLGQRFPLLYVNLWDSCTLKCALSSSTRLG